jgi:hypothetical protein
MRSPDTSAGCDPRGHAHAPDVTLRLAGAVVLADGAVDAPSRRPGMLYPRCHRSPVRNTWWNRERD